MDFVNPVHDSKVVLSTHIIYISHALCINKFYIIRYGNNFELVLEKVEKRTKHKYLYMTHLLEMVLGLNKESEPTCVCF